MLGKEKKKVGEKKEEKNISMRMLLKRTGWYSMKESEAKKRVYTLKLAVVRRVYGHSLSG